MTYSFLEYCPTKREKCYHVISRDLSCRPSEILRLKIKEVAFKTIGTSQYAEVGQITRQDCRHYHSSMIATNT